YKDLIGSIVILPILKREIPVISDIAIDMGFGTGAVKITPANDMLDFLIGEKNKLPIYQVINKYGKMTELAGKDYKGLNIKEAREKIISELEKQNLIEKIIDYNHRISKCYRCSSVIEPILSNQWFLKMDKLAKKAKKALQDRKIFFHPKHWEKVYIDWLDNIRDWCISRQLWWGHKIPLKGESDVLDTWFSSALWPIVSLGWPDKNASDLKEFYPTQVLTTSRDIINLWVTMMIFSGLEFTGKKPFTDIIIHPTVLTIDGKRMSKSLGTGIDPMIMIEKYGADATRFGLIYQMMGVQNIHFSEDSIMAGKKFANKLWNISRFVLQKTENNKIQIKNYKQIIKLKLEKEDEKILKKLDRTIKSVNKDIDKYRFGQALHTIYNFVWHDFADKYIEYSKNKENNEVKQILYFILINIIKILHPFMPFITEELWNKLEFKEKNELLIISLWPETIDNEK
ncbi:MAG: class I tRNA ligase family protein, partial [Patescibacteria group bacterium]